MSLPCSLNRRLPLLCLLLHVVPLGYIPLAFFWACDMSASGWAAQLCKSNYIVVPCFPTSATCLMCFVHQCATVNAALSIPTFMGQGALIVICQVFPPTIMIIPHARKAWVHKTHSNFYVWMASFTATSRAAGVLLLLMPTLLSWRRMSCRHASSQALATGFHMLVCFLFTCWYLLIAGVKGWTVFFWMLGAKDET